MPLSALRVNLFFGFIKFFKIFLFRKKVKFIYFKMCFYIISRTDHFKFVLIFIKKIIKLILKKKLVQAHWF